MNNDTDDAEAQEERRAAEERLIAERNAAQRASEHAGAGDAGSGEQPLILRGEDEAVAVPEMDAENADVERTVGLGGVDD